VAAPVCNPSIDRRRINMPESEETRRVKYYIATLSSDLHTWHTVETHELSKPVFSGTQEEAKNLAGMLNKGEVASYDRDLSVAFWEKVEAVREGA
jgi:hypothetical protein